MNLTKLEIFIITILTIYICVIVIFKWFFNYWTSRGFPSVPNPIIPFGSIWSVIQMKETLFELTKRIYLESRKLNRRHLGFYIFGKPFWMPVDPELIRNILLKDSAHFFNHGLYINERNDPLTANLFLIEDEKWKLTRTASSRLFSMGKLKTMFDIMKNSIEDLSNVLQEEADNETSVDMKDYSQRFFMNVIAAQAFGCDLNLIKNPDNDYGKYGKKATELNLAVSIKFLISLTIRRRWLQIIKFKLTETDIESFFVKQMENILKYRSENDVKGNDFLQFFWDLHEEGMRTTSEKGPITFKMTPTEVTANVFTFFVAGFESSSSTTTYALFEISLNDSIQEKIRDEVRSVLERHGGLSYGAVADMKYLEQVVKETLRKYPPGANVPRICTKDYKIPGEDLTIEKDTMVFIPILGVHCDPELYPNPDDFDPDRFSLEKKHLLPKNLFLPFGEGSRICIGMKLGMLQVKTILASILKDFKISLDRKKTTLPLQYSKKSMVATTSEGVWFHFSKV